MNFWVAQGAGFFEDEGLDIQVVVPPMPGAAAQFLLMGRADVAVVPYPIFLTFIAQGQALLTFANLFQNDPESLVVRQEVAQERGISSAMPLAERLNAMRGLKVGTSIGSTNLLRILFESVGLDADSDIEIVTVPPEGQDEAFANGTVDALYAHSPHLEKALVEQGGVRTSARLFS